MSKERNRRGNATDRYFRKSVSNNNTDRKNISRRKLFWIAGGLAVGGMGTATAIFGVRNDSGSDKELHGGAEFEDVIKWYPEISSQEVNGYGRFTTNLGREISWYNFQSSQVDENSLKAVYNFVEDIGNKNLVAPYNTPRGPEDFNLKPRKKNPVKIFIVNPGTVDPEIAHRQPNFPANPGTDTVAYTAIDKDTSLPFVTVIKGDDKEYLKTVSQGRAVLSGGGSPNSAIFAEACQALIQPVTDSGFSDSNIQELVCNSLMAMITFKQVGYTYSSYAGMGRISLPEFGGFGIIFSERVYNTVPKVQPIR